MGAVQERGAVRWWQRGLIYQIYPRSFADSNGDGIGDLSGIIDKLDYLRWLGVDAVWLSPVYPSPMADFGYDVSDYMNIHPMFGTLNDFDRLLAAAHQLSLKVILDLVPNHTSDQHPWFIESRSSRKNPKRDWYIWKDAAPDGGPPNNWLSTFGGSAWEWDETTEQFYYHAYLKEQPDLNWRNKDVQAAIRRHASGDWGECCPDDCQENELELQQEFRILSVYRDRKDVKFWIVTEADRSVTTVLLPEDY